MSSTAWISTMLRLWIMRIGAHKAATPRGADSQTKPVEATGQDLLLARRSRLAGRAEWDATAPASASAKASPH
jgi:hypothetical protein